MVEEVRTGRRSLAFASMRKVPAARDFDSIAGILLSNAQSDGGDGMKVLLADAKNAQPKGLASAFDQSAWNT